MTVLRGATITDPGTSGPPDLIGPNNLNDTLNAPESTVVITKGVTYTGGAVWDILKVLGSSTNQFVSVADTQMAPSKELVLRRSTPYILRIEKVGADTPANVTVNMFWYEEDWALGKLLELIERLLGLFLGTGGEKAQVEVTGIESINVDGVAAILAKIIAAPATEATLAALLANTSTTLYGATTATRPAANTVPAGTVFIAVTSPLGITMSDGTNWVVV